MDASFTDQTLHHLLSRTLRHSGSMHAHTRNSVAGVFYFLASPARHSRPRAPPFALPHPSPRHSSLCRTGHLATVRPAAPVTSPQFALPHPSPRRRPPRIPLPATSAPLHANQPRARVAAAPSSTAPREAAHARLHPHPRPIKSDAEFSSPPCHPVLAKPSRSTS